VGDNSIVKVHIHTDRPGTVLDYVCALGNLRQIAITDMQEQHDEFVEMHGTKTDEGRRTKDEGYGAAQGRIAVLAVASGAGMAQTFRSMGATAIIEGGQTMNPSTEQLLKVIESVPQNDVILLPNNGNIVLAARQTKSLTKKNVEVVATETVPQGMAATIALNVDASLEENAQAMSRAASQVETGEVTRAIRDAKVSGLSVKEGSIIGLHNNSLVVTGEERDQVTWDLLERMGAAERELITIYWGKDLNQEEASDFHQKVQERYPDAEVELVNGGQPLYDYIISAE
jgi:dihydroxyacetone kinase-like predicted kinase